MNLAIAFLTVTFLLNQHPAAPQEKKSDVPPAKEQPRKQEDPDPPPPKKIVVPAVAIADPDDRPRILGKYLKPAENQAGMVLARSGAGKWLQLTPGDSVQAGQTYLALPGCRGDLELGKVKLTLAGVLPERVPRPPLLESMIDLHQHGDLAIDLTLRRGRIVLTCEAGNPLVRIRFENPAHPDQGEIIDLLLDGKGTQVLVDRGGFTPGKHFVENPKDPLREPPAAFVGVWTLKGSAAARYGNENQAMPAKTFLLWNSLKGIYPTRARELPPTIALEPPLPEETDKDALKLRDEIFKARDDLSRESADKPIWSRLDAFRKSADVARRILALRCYSALGSVPELLDSLSDERDPRAWSATVAAAKHWMAASRDNEYRVHDELMRRFKKGESVKIMELLHGLAKPDALVDFLDNPSLLIRQLAYLNLCDVVPAGRDIRYDARMDAEQRQAAQQQWHKLLQKKDKK